MGPPPLSGAQNAAHSAAAALESFILGTAVHDTATAARRAAAALPGMLPLLVVAMAHGRDYRRWIGPWSRRLSTHFGLAGLHCLVAMDDEAEAEARAVAKGGDGSSSGNTGTGMLVLRWPAAAPWDVGVLKAAVALALARRGIAVLISELDVFWWGGDKGSSGGSGSDGDGDGCVSENRSSGGGVRRGGWCTRGGAAACIPPQLRAMGVGGEWAALRREAACLARRMRLTGMQFVACDVLPARATSVSERKPRPGT